MRRDKKVEEVITQLWYPECCRCHPSLPNYSMVDLCTPHLKEEIDRVKNMIKFHYHEDFYNNELLNMFYNELENR